MRLRLLIGSLLAAAALLVLVVDAWFEPWYPCLLLVLLVLSHVACFELLHLIPSESRPRRWLCHTGMTALVAASWLAHVRWLAFLQLTPWNWILGTFVGYVLSVFLIEMARYHHPGRVVIRAALATWLVTYLGLLPAFLAQMRWLGSSPLQGTMALVLTIFVPKFCDIGAYFSGRFLGRNRMTPLLSPKKTWEGAVGGLTLAVLAAVAIDRLGPVALLHLCWWAEIGFGLTVGLAGMLGDLAESMIKRDCGHKDAGQAVPGFGGILDVVDAIIFAAPVAYVWLWGMSMVQR